MSQKKFPFIKDQSISQSDSPLSSIDAVDTLRKDREAVVAKVLRTLSLTQNALHRNFTEPVVYCPSCMQNTPHNKTIKDMKSGLEICQDCFIQWVDLYATGRVKNIKDIIPRVMC